MKILNSVSFDKFTNNELIDLLLTQLGTSGALITGGGDDHDTTKLAWEDSVITFSMKSLRQ